MGGLGRLILATLVAGVLVAGLLFPTMVGLGMATNQVAEAIESAPADTMNGVVPLRTTVTDDTGKPLAYLYEQNRVDVPLSQISEYLQLAVISIEDRRFLQHHGVDWRGMVRALLKNSGEGGTVQGASTLTQQYVKNYLFLVDAKTDAERADAIAVTPIRKLREAKMALSLENGPDKLSKNDILDRYLNLVAFGPTTYGAEAAAQRYFGVKAIDLTLPQAALLAGMINNPNKFNPLDPDRAVDALDRRNLVLDAMARNNAISKAKAAEAKRAPIGIESHPVPNGCINAPGSSTDGYFCQYVLDYLENAGFDADDLATGGYTVRTTLDPKAMADAKAAVDAQADPGSTTTKRIANVMAVVEPGLTTRKVLALVSNRPYGLEADNGETVLRLTTTFAPLGAGSTFKVFTAAAAMEVGLGTETEIAVPKQYRSPLVPTHLFRNATENYPNQLALAQTLAESPNTAFVSLEDQIGLDKVAAMSVKMGMRGYLLDAGDVDPAFSGTGTDYETQIVQQKMASYTLGVSPVSPLELANVGATVKSDGTWCPPTPVESITDREGKLVTWEQTPCEEAVNPDLAHTLAVAMEGDLKEGGTSYAAAEAAGWDRIAAGKTGTTQDYKSSAYLGFTSQYAGAVITWDYLPRPQPICKEPLRTCTGDEAQSGQGMSGGSVPAATWLAAMKPLHEGLPNADFAPPSPQYLVGAAQAQVPDVVGLPLDQATEQVTAKGFTVGTVLSGETGAAANTVVDQSPKGNTLPGTKVTLTVATGGSTGAGSGTPGG